MLATTELRLDESEKRQLLVLADLNGDGRVEYAEFAPIGADIIQTMRLRKEVTGERAVMAEEAELMARQTLHGFNADDICRLLLEAFRHFDTDGSGKLERDEVKKCLEGLVLGNNKLTQREVSLAQALPCPTPHPSPTRPPLPDPDPTPLRARPDPHDPLPPRRGLLGLGRVQRVRASHVRVDGGRLQAGLPPV